MDADQPPGARMFEDRIAKLRHRHLNQIQNMISLAGLFGRRASDRASREAFADLRARFEALAYLAVANAEDDEAVEVNLPALAERLAEILDPDRSHRLSVSGRSATAPLHCAEGLCQVLAELVIVLFRRGLPAKGGAASVDLSLADGVLTMRAAANSASHGALIVAQDLGWSIARSVASNLGGSIELLSQTPLVAEARIPILAGAR